MRGGLIAVTLLLAGSSAAVAARSTETRRVDDSAGVIRELRSAADKGIPDSIWDKARCVAVIPQVKKGAFVIGGEYGKGVVSCRTSNGWSDPVFLTLEKGSFGLQIGAESSDLVLLVMNDRGMERLLQDKVTLGGDASLAAGPVGRTSTAATDAQLTAEMLSYSHSRGLFAGIDLSGGVLRPDAHASMDFYGHTISNREILFGTQRPSAPSAVHELTTALSGASFAGPKHGA